MIVDTRAYVISLILVLIGCIIRDFLIPLFVWKNYLCGRSYTYRFWFCVISQAFIQINLVLLLGIFNILNRYTFIIFNILIYIIIMWNYSNKMFFYNIKNTFVDLWNSYKNESLLSYISSSIASGLKNKYRNIGKWSIWIFLKKHWLEIVLILGIVIYSICFLTYNLMTYHSYQFSDIPVHQSWIYELEQGNLYADGIYPFGMHIMIYFIRTFSNINLREIMLYSGAHQFAILIIAIYLLAREIFKGKYIPLAVITITSFMINQGRYAASLPQEAGMFYVVAIAYFMIRYLHKDKSNFVIKSDSKIRSFFRISTYVNRKYIDSEMILLILSISLVISYHYYTAIAAVLVVISIALAYILRILKKRYFVPLLFCGIMGLFITLIPTGICLAKGIPFQESIDWAVTVMSGEKWQGSDADYQKNLLEALEGANETEENSNKYNLDNDSESNIDNERKIDYSQMSIRDILEHYYNAIQDFGTGVMFGYEATKLMFICMVVGFLCALIMFFYKKTRSFGYAYIALIIIMLVIFTLGSSQSLGIPEIVAASRASSFAQPFFGLIYMLPVDFIFRIITTGKGRYYQIFINGLSLVVCIIVAILIVNFGWYHNFFEVEQAYYNEAEYLTRNIKKDFDKYSYTIVSTTDEYYDIIDHGRHTELSKFVNMIDGNETSFNFPTEYVFFFIEKVILQDYNYGNVEVDYEYATKDFVFLGDIQDYYFQRAVIESKAYYWAKSFQEIYPHSFKVYYEDDIYIVYLMEQNTYFPYELQIDYLSEGENN